MGRRLAGLSIGPFRRDLDNEIVINDPHLKLLTAAVCLNETSSLAGYLRSRMLIPRLTFNEELDRRSR